MSGVCNVEKGSQQVVRSPSLSLKMQWGFRKMKRNIRKMTESSSVQPHCVFVENMQDDEQKYVFPDRLSSLTCQTGFTRDEIRKLYRAFKQHCPRGAATPNDLKPAYAKLFPLGDPAKYCQIVFNAFDQDGDGLVSFGELLTEVALIIRGDIDEKLAWIFRFYDLNGDGRITRKEMLIIVSAIYQMLYNNQPIQRMANWHVDRLFQKMDVDKDGVISKEEFVNSCKNVQ